MTYDHCDYKNICSEYEPETCLCTFFYTLCRTYKRQQSERSPKVSLIERLGEDGFPVRDGRNV